MTAVATPPVRRSPWAWWAAAVCGPLLLASCSPATPHKPPTAAPIVTVTASPTVVPTGADTPSPPSQVSSSTGRPPGPPQPSQSNPVDLKAALLSLADLSGFRAGRNVKSNAEGGCPALDTGLDPGVVASAEVLFEKTATGPFIRERILRYGSVAAAEAALSAARRSPSTCSSFTVTEPNIGRINYSVTSLPFTAYGDDTVAVRLTATPESFPDIHSRQNLVIVRVGRDLIMISHTVTGSIDDGFTNTVVGKAYAKYKSR